MKKRKLKKMSHWWRKCRLATQTWKKLDLPKECREGPALQLRERLTLQEIPEERGSQGALQKTGTKNWCFIICLSINQVLSCLKFVYSTLNWEILCTLVSRNIFGERKLHQREYIVLFGLAKARL